MKKIGIAFGAVLWTALAMAAELDLAGTWQLRDEWGGHACAAKVPGDVYGALLDSKQIPDPYRGRNELEVQWPRRVGWTFSRKFTVDAAMLADPSIILRLDEVDLFCTVKINGRKVGQTDNRFRRWEFDVKKFLKEGENTIEGVFESAELKAAELRRGYHRSYGASFDWVENMPLIRKPACHQGWDWGVTIMVTGFCGEVKLISTAADGRRIDYVYSEQRFTPDMKHVDVTVFAEVTDAAGAHAVVTNTVAIDNPKLWWPAGMGEQSLTEIPYTVDGRRYVKRLGLRRLELVRGTEKDPSFHFEVNGVPFFAKGANWIPADALENRLTPERYRDLLETSVAANFNMLRVWGGGLYEKPFFYEMCDELGLVVWQDFMFSCAVYPSDPAFLENVRLEAEHQVKRLRDYASLALWCGDNECLGANEWFAGRKYGDENLADWKARAAVLAAAVAKCDPTRVFWPSSPCWGPDDFRDGWNPACLGDLHYWRVWGNGKDIEEYQGFVPLFASEFGFQSYPSPEVAATFCALKGVSEPEFAHHQKAPGDGNGKIRDTTVRYFGEAKDFRSLLYLSQVAQAYAIRSAVEWWRPMEPKCMGSLYWQLNDNWPVSSWASVEYGGKWKQLQYHAKRFYAPVAVMGRVERSGDGAITVSVYGLNDGAEPLEAVLETYACGFDGSIRRLAAEPVTLAARSATLFAKRPFADFGGATNAVYAAYRLRDKAGRLLAGNENFFARLSDCAVAKDPLEVKVDGLEVTLTAPKGAFYVWANAEGLRGEFNDNSIALLPGETRTLVFTPREPLAGPDRFERALTVTHLGAALK